MSTGREAKTCRTEPQVWRLRIGGRTSEAGDQLSEEPRGSEVSPARGRVSTTSNSSDVQEG